MSRSIDEIAEQLCQEAFGETLGEFEKRWTANGIPDEPGIRFQCGLALGQLVRAGANIQTLADYVEETLQLLEFLVRAERSNEN